jgi:signal transduction histidine kinase
MLSLGEGDGELRLDVDDDGVGFDAHATYPGHLGLQSMRERATAVGAVLAVDSAPQRGTRLSVRLPLSERARAGRVGADPDGPG